MNSNDPNEDSFIMPADQQPGAFVCARCNSKRLIVQRMAGGIDNGIRVRMMCMECFLKVDFVLPEGAGVLLGGQRV